MGRLVLALVLLAGRASARNSGNDIAVESGTVTANCAKGTPTFACLAGRATNTNDILGSTSGTPGWTLTGSNNNAAGAGLVLKGNTNAVGTITLQSNTAGVTTAPRTAIAFNDPITVGQAGMTWTSNNALVVLLPGGITLGAGGEVTGVGTGVQTWTLSAVTANGPGTFFNPNPIIRNASGVSIVGEGGFLPFPNNPTYTADGNAVSGTALGIIGPFGGLLPTSGFLDRTVFNIANNGHGTVDSYTSTVAQPQIGAGWFFTNLYGDGVDGAGAAGPQAVVNGTVGTYYRWRTWNLAAQAGGAIRNPFQFGGPGQKVFLNTPLAPTSGAFTAGGSVTNGTHSWEYTCVNGAGESAASAASAQQNSTGGNQTETLTVPVCTLPAGAACAAGACRRRIYRTAAGDSPPYKLVGTIENNTGTSFVDTFADVTLDVATPAGAGNTVPSGELAFGVLNRDSPPAGAPTQSFFTKDDQQHLMRMPLQSLVFVGEGNVAGDTGGLSTGATATALAFATHGTDASSINSADIVAPGGAIHVHGLLCHVLVVPGGTTNRTFDVYSRTVGQALGSVTLSNGVAGQSVQCAITAAARTCTVWNNTGFAIAEGNSVGVRMLNSGTPAATDGSCVVYYANDML